MMDQKPTIPIHPPRPDDRYYYTSNLYLAAYLAMKGLPLVNVEAASRTIVYTFRDAPEREGWVDTFKNGPQALVDARRFTMTIKDLQHLTARAACERCSSIE